MIVAPFAILVGFAMVRFLGIHSWWIRLLLLPGLGAGLALSLYGVFDSTWIVAGMLFCVSMILLRRPPQSLEEGPACSPWEPLLLFVSFLPIWVVAMAKGAGFIGLLFQTLTFVTVYAGLRTSARARLPAWLGVGLLFFSGLSGLVMTIPVSVTAVQLMVFAALVARSLSDRVEIRVYAVLALIGGFGWGEGATAAAGLALGILDLMQGRRPWILVLFLCFVNFDPALPQISPWLVLLPLLLRYSARSHIVTLLVLLEPLSWIFKGAITPGTGAAGACGYLFGAAILKDWQPASQGWPRLVKFGDGWKLHLPGRSLLAACLTLGFFVGLAPFGLIGVKHAGECLRLFRLARSRSFDSSFQARFGGEVAHFAVALQNQKSDKPPLFALGAEPIGRLGPFPTRTLVDFPVRFTNVGAQTLSLLDIKGVKAQVHAPNEDTSFEAPWQALHRSRLEPGESFVLNVTLATSRVEGDGPVRLYFLKRDGSRIRIPWTGLHKHLTISTWRRLSPLATYENLEESAGHGP